MKKSEKLIESYLNDVLGPMGEPEKSRMTDAFHAGMSVGIFQSAETVYDTVQELKASALARIAIRNQEEGE